MGFRDKKNFKDLFSPCERCKGLHPSCSGCCAVCERMTECTLDKQICHIPVNISRIKIPDWIEVYRHSHGEYELTPKNKNGEIYLNDMKAREREIFIEMAVSKGLVQGSIFEPLAKSERSQSEEECSDSKFSFAGGRVVIPKDIELINYGNGHIETVCHTSYGKLKYGQMTAREKSDLTVFCLNNKLCTDKSDNSTLANIDKGGINNKNYNNLWVYNSNQSTGKLNLNFYNQQTNPYSQLENLPDTKYIVEADHNSKISNLWDYSTDNVISSSSPSNIETEFNLNGYIDKVPQNIDFNKSSYEAGELRDKYAITRLYYYPDTDSEKVTHRLGNTKEMQSIR